MTDAPMPSPSVRREVMRLLSVMPAITSDSGLLREVVRRACNASGALAGGILVLSGEDESFRLAAAAGSIRRAPRLSAAVATIVDERSSIGEVLDAVRSVGLSWPPAHPTQLRDPDDAYELVTVPLRDVRGESWGQALFVFDSPPPMAATVEGIELILDIFTLWSWVRHARHSRERAGETSLHMPGLFRVDRLMGMLMHDVNGAVAAVSMQNELLDIVGHETDQLVTVQSRFRESLARLGRTTALIEDIGVHWQNPNAPANPANCAAIAAMCLRDLRSTGVVSTQIMDQAALPDVRIDVPVPVVSWVYLNAMRYVFAPANQVPVRPSSPVSMFVDLNDTAHDSGGVCLCLDLVGATDEMCRTVDAPTYAESLRHSVLARVVGMLDGELRIFRDETGIHIHVELPTR